MRSILVMVLLLTTTNVALAQSTATNGQRVFQACAACHSLQANNNLTGPSLSGVFGRKAGALESFNRYSDALKSSGIIWNDNTLDAWIANPKAIVPGNEMTFAGIANAQQRADLLAFLKQATKPGAATAQAQGGGMGGMMMGGGQVPNLKKLDAEDRVQSVGYCNDTYEVATADGKKRKFWERNLRFKTDSGEDGPTKGAPALVPAGMAGDRADVIFSDPEEFGQFVRQECQRNSN
jgi:cytochrome c